MTGGKGTPIQKNQPSTHNFPINLEHCPETLKYSFKTAFAVKTYIEQSPQSFK